jgi:ribosomal-protein-alanine N-acetyltransferase
VKASLGETYPPSLYLTINNLWPQGFLVIQDGRALVGFVAAVISGTKVARVLMLAVSPEHRRRSLGQRLMQALYEACAVSGIDTVALEVRKSNTSALQFYRKQGYEIAGEIKNFYSNGEDAYKLVRVLQS